MPYHYRLVVPTGYAQDARDQIEPPDIVENQIDGSKFAEDNDVTMLTVQSARLDSLDQVKAWVDATPDVATSTIVTMVGTPASVHDSDLSSLKSMVAAHQELDVDAPAKH